MSDQPIASGPGPYSDVPYDVFSQKLLSVSSRRGSIQSGHIGGAGNILDLFRSNSHQTHDEFNPDIEDNIGFYTEQTPLKSDNIAQNLRDPTNYTHLNQDNTIISTATNLHNNNNNNNNNDLISQISHINSLSVNHLALQPSLASLKRIRSHSTIKHVILEGSLPEVETSVKEEFSILTKYSIPLVITFLLQYSLNVASVFSVGKIGKSELAAVSLAGMTANITGYCLFQGAATALDTLCPQAYGRKDYKQVGLQFLKCTIFLFLISIPVSLVWIFGAPLILNFLVDDEKLISLATSYLSILAIGLPGFILFETLKKYLQAQNIFHASTYVILFAAPFNAFTNYYLVWSEFFNLGFIGAPIAIVLTNYIMASLLLIYTIYIDGYQCWCGISKDVFKNWSKMLNLSYNGTISVVSEWLFFELITLSAARFGTVELAAQSVLATICILIYQIPFAISIAVSTRIANFIGSASKKSSIISTHSSIIFALIVGIFNAIILTIFKYNIVELFTDDEQVIKLASEIIPLGALYQINDCLAAITGGILRGQGRQRLSAYISLVSYYLISLPFGFYFAFGLNFKLFGLWSGLVLAIILISISQIIFVLKSNWDSIINESLQDALNEVNINADTRSILSHTIHDELDNLSLI
ncbi:hypothetical protein WICMUC_003707 [Wickerhamomyces mucosus]|uniref:MATE efflux family protein n=1 Tax=Wickerhamomyces mucosus TaxID=1378264 RepID=A0A9P8PL33_9ASCO|nr:hypothetical protein WICMUC_003707 [Wickerhamomyces mucosus]